MRRSWVTLAALGALLALGGEARAKGLVVLPEGVRVDLHTGLVLDGLDAEDPVPLDRARKISARPIRLRAARDEVFAFQVALTGEEQRVARAEITGFEGGIRATLFQERALVVTSPSESSKVFSLGPGHYPDILIPTSTVTIPAPPGLAVLWIDLFVPRETEAGVYNGVLRVEGTEELPIQLEVLRITLPERDVAKLGAVSFGSFLEREKEDPALLRRWMQLAHAHHLSIELMRPTPRVNEAGVIDWDAWATRFAPYLDGSAFAAKAGYIGPRANKPVTRFVAPVAERWPTEPTPDGFLPADGARWSKALGELEQLIVRRGWLEIPDRTEWILFINSLDEPKSPEKLDALMRYEALIQAAKLLERRHFTFRVDGVLGARIQDWPDHRKLRELGGVVDLWNLHGAVDTAPIDLLTDRFEKHTDERAIFYASNSGGEPAIPPVVVDSPVVGPRAWGWIVARYGLDGALNWEVDFAPGCVENQRCSPGGFLNLDALLIYRGEEVGQARGEPVASMRLKALRRGAQDAALLALARERSPDRARWIVERMVPRALGDGLYKDGRGMWPRSAQLYHEAREELLSLLDDGVDRDVLKAPRVLILCAAAAVIIGIIFMRVRSQRTPGGR